MGRVPGTEQLNLAVMKHRDNLCLYSNVLANYQPSLMLAVPNTLKNRHPLSGRPPPEQDRFIR